MAASPDRSALDRGATSYSAISAEVSTDFPAKPAITGEGVSTDSDPPPWPSCACSSASRPWRRAEGRPHRFGRWRGDGGRRPDGAVDATNRRRVRRVRARPDSQPDASGAAKKNRGERAGHVPYGFQVAEDGRTLARHDDEQATLTLLRHLRSKGYTLAGIAAALNQRGVRTRRRNGPWSHQFVCQLLSRHPTEIT